MTFFLPTSFFLGLVLVLVQQVNQSKALFLAFLIGILLDLFSGQILGFSSLFFLVFSYIIILLNNRFSFSRPLASFLITLIFYFFFQVFLKKPFDITEGLLLSLMVTIFCLRKREKIIL